MATLHHTPLQIQISTGDQLDEILITSYIIHLVNESMMLQSQCEVHMQSLTKNDPQLTLVPSWP